MSSTSSSPSPYLHSPPVITPRAQPSPEPTHLVLDLTTLVTISDFAAFYPATSPDSFRPVYYALADGSLVASPFRDDLTLNSVFLIIAGCLLSIFLRNVCKAATYLWRGKVKKKCLLYILFLSQLLGPIAIVPIIVAQFGPSVNCVVILRFFFIASGVSLSLLVTGIFGIKAHKCLNSNRLVSGVLIALRTAGSVVLILDVVHIHSFRSLSGRCYRPSPGLSSIFVILLLTESLFVCACFLYAIRNPHGPVAVRGRISVRLSLDDVAHGRPPESRKESAGSVPGRRGWSDFKSHTNHLSTSWQTSPLSRESSITSIPHDAFQDGHNAGTAQSPNRPIPFPFPSTIHPHPVPPRPCTVRMQTTCDDSYLPENTTTSFKPPTSPTYSLTSRFTRYIPRMSLFREVMRDELCYTAITAIFTVVSTVTILVGIKRAGGTDSTIWVAFDWTLISLLVVHSFARAIRRHEDESLLLHPYTKYHDLHTDRTTAELLGDVPQPVRAPRMLARARTRRSVARYPEGGASSELSTRRLFPGSTHSSRSDLHSPTVSTSDTSNAFPSVETESFSRTQVSSTICMKDGPSQSLTSPEEWFNNSLFRVPPPPEPPDDGRSYVS